MMVTPTVNQYTIINKIVYILFFNTKSPNSSDYFTPTAASPFECCIFIRNT